MVMLSNRGTPGGTAADFRSPNYLLEKSILNRSNALAQPSPQQQQASTGSRMQLSPEQLEVGARLVDVCLRSDRSFNDLRWKLKLQRTDVPTISGLADSDYPNLQSMGVELNEFVTSRRQPIPQELVDQFAHMQCNCAMGLFPEISRAWLTIDSDLFVWNYETNGDLAYFDGLPNAILKMALARPKAGVFHAHIHYILVVATAVDVALLGVSFSDESSQPVSPREFKRAEMHLVPEPLFKVPLDGAVVADIACTREGRIFLGARDGCLYEIDYQDKGWFRRHCKKINHSKGIISYLVPSLVTSTFGKDHPLVQMAIDETRHVLYTRTESGSIQVFNMGGDGRQMSKVSSMSAEAVQHYASSICQTMEPSNFRPIVHISPVGSTDSQVISLQAVTESGVRLYFSCYHPSPMDYAYTGADGSVDQQNAYDDGAPTKSQADVRPVTLRLVHVRLPPGLAASSTVARPMRVHLGYLPTDGYLFVTGVDEENDTLWAFSDANFPFQSDLMETLTQLPIRGRTWAIAEAGQDFDVQAYESVVARQSVNAVLPVRPPLTVYQHTEQPKQMIVLTAQGIHMIEQQRPVDLLRSLLLTHGADSREVGDFFALHRADHACAMCLIIMCASGAVNTQAADAALRAFFVYGGDPQMFFAPLTPNIPDANLDWSRNGSIAEWTHHMRSPLQASTPQQSPSMFANRQTQSPMGNRSLIGRQPYGDQQQQPPMSPTAPEVKYSHRHNGMYAYFSRIVGQLWNMRVCIEKNNMIESAFLSEELAWLASQLTRLREAIDAHSLIPRPAYINTTVAVANQPVNIHSRMIGFMRADTVDSNAQQTRAQISKKHQVEAINEERQSLLCLYELVDRSAEVLSLWKILTDHQFHVIVAQLPVDIRRLLVDVPFSQLVTAGKDLCSDLITCLIRQYLGDRATTDAISERLRKACPGLYSSDDATVAKATELVQRARSMEECDAKAQLMEEALRMFKGVVQRIHLPTICLQFQDAHCYDKIVDLALCAAEKADPQHLALTVYKTPDSTAAESLPTRLLNSRMSCYGCVTDALDQLVDPSATALDARMTEQLATMYSEQMLNAVLSSTDELAHVAVFDWMLERSMSERMLK
uniref:Nucleoporin Nup133/Nup155-like N-terminal domain-containing protein n=1 Tax=Plectus sambesii TaxID=2011161 RepID=A0A914UNX2_9BILA